MRKLSLFLLCALALAGCGGGGAKAVPGGLAPAGDHATASVAITVPRGATSSAHARRPHYVSQSTQSVAIAVGGQTTYANISATSSSCAATAGKLVCTVPVNAPVGQDTFTVTTYDAPLSGSTVPATANALSKGTVVATIANDTANLVKVVLDGIPASLAIAPATTTLPARTASTFALTLSAKDADGNTILDPGNYAPAVTVASDTAGITLAVGSGAPAQSVNVGDPTQNVLTVNVPNTAASGTVTFTASVPGVTPATATLKLTAGVSAIYNSNHWLETKPENIAKASNGLFWFTGGGANYSIGTLNPADGTVGVLAARSGLDQPLTITAGPSVGGSQKMYMLGQSGGLEAIDTANGNIALAGGIGTPNHPTFFLTNGVTHDANGIIYYTGGNYVGRFDPSTNAAPVERAVPTAGSQPADITVDPNTGLVWFTETNANSVASYNPQTNAFAEYPTHSAANAPISIAYSPADHRIWFANTNGGTGAPNGSIVSFDPAHPTAFSEYPINGGTVVDTAQGLVATPDGWIFFGEGLHALQLGRVSTGASGLPPAGTMTHVPMIRPNSGSSAGNQGVQGLTVDTTGSLFFVGTQPTDLGHFVY